MGGRLLKKWISAPLRDLDKVQKRLDAVEELLKEKIEALDSLKLLSLVSGFNVSQN